MTHAALPYFHGWFESEDDVFNSFEVPQDDRGKWEVLVGAYTEDYGWDGHAFVLARNREDGHLYEAYGSHCSCYGLEDQWSPELCVPEELIKRPVIFSGAYDQPEDPGLRLAVAIAVGSA